MTPDHDPETLRALLERAYDRIEKLEDKLTSADGVRELDRRTTAELQSRLDDARATMQMLQSKADRLAGAVRNVVDNPLTGRTEVQGKLLVALEVFDGRRP